MKATIRLPLALLLLLCPALARAAAPPSSDPLPDPMPAIHADNWTAAAAAAAQYADPVAQKLVTYYRLLTPGAATEQEIAAFVASSPDWPGQVLLERRRQEAIAADPDDAAVLAQCGQTSGQTGSPATSTTTIPGAPFDPITLPAARLRCASALANAGRNTQAAAEARRAWITGFAADAADFPQRWHAVLTPADQWERFQTLDWSDPTDAAREVPLLDPPHRALAAARLALRHDDPTAAALLAAVPRALADDPGLMLAQAGWLRRAERIPDAVALWRAHGAAAQRAATSAEISGFWPERERLARHLLNGGPPPAAPPPASTARTPAASAPAPTATAPTPASNANIADAYALVDDPGPIPPRQALDADFLAGFIALRLLNEPAGRDAPFPGARRRLAGGDHPGARLVLAGPRRRRADQHADPGNADYAKVGRLAHHVLRPACRPGAGRRRQGPRRPHRRAARPPGTRSAAFGLTQREVVRAAALLVAWSEPHRAEAFLLRMDDLAPDLADRALTADLALCLGLPETAVFDRPAHGPRRADAAAGRLADAGRPATGQCRSRDRARADPPGEQFRQRRRQPGRRARADAAHAGHRRHAGAADRHHGDPGRAGVRSGAQHAPGHRVSAGDAGSLRQLTAAGGRRLQRRAATGSTSGWRRTATRAPRPTRRPLGAPQGLQSTCTNRHDRLDRADPVRAKPATTCSACWRTS